VSPARPQPALARASMTPVPWAGHPLARLVARALGRSVRGPRLAARGPLLLRRLMLLLLVIASALLGTDYMAEILPHDGRTWVEQALLVLFGLLFAWISAGFWTAVMGLFVLLRSGRNDGTLEASGAPACPIDPAARTAIVMPICNEHVPTVFAGLRATYESLRQTSQLERFDFFVLSDTSNPDLRADEHAAYAELRASLDAAGQGGNVYYRWRQHRTRRKAGNVADFCRRWGRSYRYMIVLDADSVMSGDCLTRLVQLMETHPDAGIIQTAPRACGHSTFHARAQQFGAAVYGPLFTAGMHFWQLGESHYWGHNAILRIAPFMQHCALARLPGNGSLSGEIMSHDFVEAALMRRAGWKAWVVPDLPGSYEQVPPNLIAELQRDRRWCHGNLQNARLMFEPGLHPVHRSVFATGVLSYVSAPLWFAFLLLSTLLFAQTATTVPQYFVAPYQLFPIWPVSDIKLMLTLFGMTALLLVAPKLLALAVIAIQGKARLHGGTSRMLASAGVEFVYTTLLAPVRMLFHSQFVLAALLGWRMRWTSPPRDGDATPLRQAWRRHGVHTLLAVGWVAGIVAVGSAFPWWLSPVIGGLLLAVPLSVVGSWSSLGRFLARRSVLLIPEEVEEAGVLRAARRHAACASPACGFTGAVLDDAARERVRVAAMPLAASRGLKAVAREKLISRAVTEGPHALATADRMRLLGDADALQSLAANLGSDVAHPAWAEARLRQARRSAHVAVRPPTRAVSGTGVLAGQ